MPLRSGFDIAKACQGYRTVKPATGCHNCALPKSAHGLIGGKQLCSKGGFYVSMYGTCDEFQPRGAASPQPTTTGATAT